MSKCLNEPEPRTCWELERSVELEKRGDCRAAAKLPRVRRGAPRSIAGVGPRNLGLGEHFAEPSSIYPATDVACSEERVEGAVVAPFVVFAAEERARDDRPAGTHHKPRRARRVDDVLG